MSIKSKLRAVLTMGTGVTKGLTELEVANDPVAFFGRWFEDAKKAGIFLPEAMAVATATSDGRPSVRQMLLKSFGGDGFVFYTNYDSRKVAELNANPRAALCFHWGVLQRQVRVEGTVETLSADESDAYFQTRARGSRIGAWASQQSAQLSSREQLEGRFREFDEKFKGDVPRPAFWGGFRLVPERIEFWQGRLNRLHDRLLYTVQDGKWDVTRLYP
jgi:pyridoxamine 5'-phosphate oxidase